MNTTTANKRLVIVDGRNVNEVTRILNGDLGTAGIQSATRKAARIIELSVDPIGGPPAESSDGLLYGLIQSGKTSILTVAAAMAADNGFQCILVLTTDNDPLYDQTLERVRVALRGMSVLGKRDWRDPNRFARQVRTAPFAVVCSKNGSMLQGLLDAFKQARAKGLSVLIIDDEADQASLNTNTSRGGQISRINRVITDFRNYFPTNTYLQVTATPQALFLQRPDHSYRPSFTVITEPGKGYVGGEAFFGEDRNKLLRTVDLAKVNQLRATNQPFPSGTVPRGLRRALYTFFVGAASRVIDRPTEGFAFLCHVSMATRDHTYIVGLLDSFKEEVINGFANKTSSSYSELIKGLRDAYTDLSSTEPQLRSFEKIVDQIEFYIQGANIKLVNASSNDEIKLDSVFNLFAGGNKLGRGVTIKNLLVSYYGRNPRTPNADTVLQHARMYGYRQKDLGVTRLFLPQRLADHFESIHQMETALRDLLQQYPDGCFEGLYMSSQWQPTRRNVLDPTSLGFYLAGQSYNPSYPVRDASSKKATDWLDKELKSIGDKEPYQTVSIDRVIELVSRCEADANLGPVQFWNLQAIKSALDILKNLRDENKKPRYVRAYLVVRRDRNLTQPRRETQGIIDSAEYALAPVDSPTLFLYRQNPTSKGEPAVWWPQLRFPVGNYVLAFSFDW